jgi:hypothetical protein
MFIKYINEFYSPPPISPELLARSKQAREKRKEEISNREDWYNGEFSDINLMSNETLYDKFVSLTEEQIEDLKNNVGEENLHKIYDKIIAYLTEKIKLLEEPKKKLLNEDALQTHKGGSKLTRRRRKKRNQTNRKKNGLYADEYFERT